MRFDGAVTVTWNELLPFIQKLFRNVWVRCRIKPVDVEGGLARVIQRAQQPTSQAVVVEVALVAPSVEVAVHLQSEGVDGHGRATKKSV